MFKQPATLVIVIEICLEFLKEKNFNDLKYDVSFSDDLDLFWYDLLILF